MKLLPLLLLIAMPLLGQSALPFTLDNPSHAPFPTELAARIYRTALIDVARDINPQSPPLITPNLVVKMVPKADKPLLRTTDGVTTLTMEKWSLVDFAYACTWSAVHSVVPPARVRDITRWVLSETTATIDVNELKRKPQ